MTSVLKDLSRIFNSKSHQPASLVRSQNLNVIKVNNGFNISSSLDDTKLIEKNLLKILKESFRIPKSIENQPIGYARTIEFVRYILSAGSDGSIQNIESSSNYLDEIKISFKGISLYDSYVNFNSRDVYIFFFIKELMSDKYLKEASFNERLIRTGEKLASFYNYSYQVKDLLNQYVKFFESKISVTENIDLIFNKYKTQELFLNSSARGWPEYRFQKEFKAAIESPISAISRHFASIIGDNFDKIDVKFLKENSSVKLKGLRKKSTLKLLKCSILASLSPIYKGWHSYYNMSDEIIMARLNISAENLAILKNEILKFSNYSEDSHELQAYVNSNKRIKNKKVYSYAELSSISYDTIYGPYRSSKLVKEFKANNIGNTYFEAQLAKVQPTKVLELLPEMGKYFIQNYSSEQEAYVNTLIKSLANKLAANSSIFDNSLTDEAMKMKAKELVNLARYQNKESGLIYGRQASSLFLQLSPNKLKSLEENNYELIIENGKTLDNIIVGLIIGLMKV